MVDLYQGEVIGDLGKLDGHGERVMLYPWGKDRKKEKREEEGE
jgi:hypothetical protein